MRQMSFGPTNTPSKAGECWITNKQSKRKRTENKMNDENRENRMGIAKERNIVCMKN